MIRSLEAGHSINNSDLTQDDLEGEISETLFDKRDNNFVGNFTFL